MLSVTMPKKRVDRYFAAVEKEISVDMPTIIRIYITRVWAGSSALSKLFLNNVPTFEKKMVLSDSYLLSQHMRLTILSFLPMKAVTSKVCWR